MSKLVTVFGGSGFLGRHTVRALARAGHRVRVAVRKPASAWYLLPNGHVGQIQIVKADVMDAEQVAAAIAGSDAVVNLCGILYPQGGNGFDDIHCTGACNVAKAAKDAGVPTLVHVSALGADAESKSSYARTKGEGEALVREEFPNATILRPSILFGPEDGFFNLFAWLARFSPAIPLAGGGHTKFQPVFVGDVAAAIRASVEKTEAAGKTLELGGPSTYTFKELIEAILRVTDRKRILVPLPFALMKVKGFFLGLLPKPMLTMDQVELLKTDNVCTPGSEGFSALGLAPTTSVEAEIPSYLWRFKAKGQFQPLTSA